MDMIYQFQTTAPSSDVAIEQAHQAMTEMLKAYPTAELTALPVLEVIDATDLLAKTFRFTQKFTVETE